MLRSVFLTACYISTCIAHGHVKDYIVDGITFPGFDPTYDHDTKWGTKRIEWGFPKAKGNVGPVENVASPDIGCRWQPLKEPSLEAVVRAGANVTFKWYDWFGNHKGPLFTYMGVLPESGKIDAVDFFKIDEATYDPKTRTWGSDWLVKNDNYHTSTIPSDIKPGTYVVRHELISLHNALNDDYVKKQSGAQFYPQCIKVKVIGDGNASPAGVKFPGAYKWDDKGILINLYYRPNEYVSPGPAVYKPSNPALPKGPVPTGENTGVLAGALGDEYKRLKANSDKTWANAVHADVAAHPGGGGCIWEPSADPKTATCSSTNEKDPKYRGLGQPPHSPMYVDEESANRKKIGRGPIIKYLFDPTQPRWEQRQKAQAARRRL